MATAAKRSERIEARITPDGLAILREAAELEGRSLSEFVVSAKRRRLGRRSIRIGNLGFRLPIRSSLSNHF